MAEMTLKLHCKIAWWLKPALFATFLLPGRKHTWNWLIDRAVTYSTEPK